MLCLKTKCKRPLKTSIFKSNSFPYLSNFAGPFIALHRILSQRSSSCFNCFSPVGDIRIIRTRNITIKPPQNVISLLSTTLHDITRVFTRASQTFPPEGRTSLQVHDIAGFPLPCASALRAESGALLRKLAVVAPHDGDVTGRAPLRALIGRASATVSDRARGAGEGRRASVHLALGVRLVVYRRFL